MRFLLTFKVFDSIFRDEDVASIRQAVGAQLGKVHQSGKLVEGGMLADRRGGFFLVDVSESSEIYELLGGVIYDHCDVEVTPVISFEALADFFEKEASG